MENLFNVTEVSLQYKSKQPATIQITSSRTAEKVLRSAWSEDMEISEEFVVLFLNKANKVKCLYKMSKGGMSGTVVDSKLIFAAALKALAAGIILCHNHPSGNLQPSQADIDLTKRLKQVGTLLDLPILDHLILSPFGGYYSFADEGLL